MNALGLVASDIAAPTSWKRCRLKDVLEYCNRGIAPDYADSDIAEVIAVSQKCVYDSRVDPRQGRPMEADQDVGPANLRRNDVLVNSTGRGTLGRVGLVEELPDDARLVADGHVTILRVRPDELDPRYLKYVLGNDDFYRFANESLAVGSTNQTELSRDRLRSLALGIPPLQQQRRIADYLDAQCLRINAAVEEHSRLVGLLWERRQSLVFDSVTGRSKSGSRRSGVPWVDSIPSGWGTARLTTVARLGSGHTPSRNRPELWQDCTIPWITTGEVWQIRSDEQEILTETREKISVEGVAESAATVHAAGTVVLCRTAASAGYSAVMGTDMATSQDFATWTCGPLLEPRFLLYCLRAMRRDLLERLAIGSTHRTIYMPEIKSLVIPLPTPKEQREIVERLSKDLVDLDHLRDALTHQTELLRERLQALITSAVSGQFDVSSAA